MFCHLFTATEYLFPGMGKRSIDRTFHGVGSNRVAYDLYKRLRRETDELSFKIEFIFGFGIAKDLFEAEVGLYGGLEGKVEQVGIA